jgi:hypothetical protein
MSSLVSGSAATFEQPFEMLKACHERVERMLALRRACATPSGHGADADARCRT